MTTKCDFCTNEATGILEGYYHDGGTLYARPICDACGIVHPTEYRPSGDPDRRPASVYYRLGTEDTARFLYYVKLLKSYSFAWGHIGRSCFEFENHVKE